MSDKIDTRAIGLDVGLEFIRWVTGAENLHYGLWDGFEVTAGNLGAAQAAYTGKLFGLLPPGPLRILDVGGGAGETAKKLLALGHSVDIVVPSAFLAGRCRANAPAATVHESTFEAFDAGDTAYDLCLFSESFQYIPLDIALPKALSLVGPGGHVIVSDCFRSDAFKGSGRKTRIPGGGHRVTAFRAAVAELPVEITHDEDITDAVAPSIDLEQAFFHVLGHAITRIDGELVAKRPKARWLLARLLRSLLGKRRRHRIDRRLRGDDRTADVFRANNRYLMVRLRKT